MSTLLLPCKLNDVEKLELSGRLSKELDHLEAVKAEKREAVSGFNTKIKGHEGTIHTLNDSLKRGEEEREVEVRDEKDPASGIMRVVRVDTGETVNMSNLDPDERQLLLGRDGPKLGSVPADTTDEQSEAGSPEEAEFLREQRLRREREERRAALVKELWPSITCRAGDGDAGEEAFVATVAHAGVTYSADAADEPGAKNGVIEAVLAVVDQPALNPEATPRVYSAAVQNKVAELLPRIEVRSPVVGAAGPLYFIAKVETPAWVAEREGNTEEQARQALIAAVLEVFADEEAAIAAAAQPTWEEVQAASKAKADADEIARLAADQAADDTKTKKALLRKPTKGPQPKKLGKGMTVEDPDGKTLARGRDEEGAPEVDTTPPIVDGEPVGF